MKRISIILLFFFISNFGCGLRGREAELERREAEINQKEQQLLLLEKELQLKETALTEREQNLDTLPRPVPAADSSFVDTTIAGDWSANMRCTETTCEGSAVGDTKNEVWTIAYQNNAVIVKAMADKKLVRTYTGTYTGDGLQLTAQLEPAALANKITVTLEQKSNDEMEGIREIRRPENCRIVYAITLKKI